MRLIPAAALLLLGILLSGCASAESVQRSGDSIMLVATDRPSAVMEALIIGTLTRTDTGCLALEQEGHIYVLQFPYGSTLADDGESVEVPGAGTIALGGDVTGGGGYIDLPSAPEECGDSTEFAVWQTVL